MGSCVNYLTCLEFSVLCKHAAHINTMFTNKIITLIIYYSYLIKKKSDILSNNLRTLSVFLMDDKQNDKKLKLRKVEKCTALKPAFDFFSCGKRIELLLPL